nr:smalltalk protein [uncultured Prevotella sp.]
MKNTFFSKETCKTILQIAISVLTAIATALGVNSCM